MAAKVNSGTTWSNKTTLNLLIIVSYRNKGIVADAVLEKQYVHP